MKKVLVFLIFGIILMSFIIAEQTQSQNQGQNQNQVGNNNSDNEDDDGIQSNDSDDEDDENEVECEDYRYSTCPEGCLKRCVSSTNCPANDTGCIRTADCEGRGSCYEKKDKKRIKNITKEEIREIVKERNRIKFEQRTGVECPEDCKCTGVTVKCQLDDGGREMTVYAKSGNIIIQVKNVNATTQVTLYHHDNKTYGIFENNETKEIILPDKVKEKIQEKLKAKIENSNITLNEDGYYQVQIRKKARFFFLFPIKEEIRVQLDAENGDVIKIKNPWWGFLAKDSEEDIEE